jgi:hypothetical protein
VPAADDPHGTLPPLLLALTVVTGLVDAFSYLVLGQVFVANMTGNVVFLGFALAGANGFSIPASLVALGGFSLGALIGSRVSTRLGGHRGRLPPWRRRSGTAGRPPPTTAGHPGSPSAFRAAISRRRVPACRRWGSTPPDALRCWWSLRIRYGTPPSSRGRSGRRGRPWASPGGDVPDSPVVVANADGRLELFTLGISVGPTGDTNAHAIWHRRQDIPGGDCAVPMTKLHHMLTHYRPWGIRATRACSSSSPAADGRSSWRLRSSPTRR